MKKAFTKILLLSLVVNGLAFRSGDVLTDLKLSPEQVGEQVFNQLTAGEPVLRVPYESRQIFRQFSTPMRVASVKAMYAVVHTYVKSDNFLTRYDGWLRSKYDVEEGNELPEAASTQELKVAQESQLTQILGAFSNMTPQILSLMLPQQLAKLQQQMHNADAPSKAALTRDIMVLRELQPLATTRPAEFKTRYLVFMKRTLTQQISQGTEAEEGRLAQAHEKAQAHRSRLAEYHANADPNLALKKRLYDFIDLAESVDFAAETVKQGYKTEFVRADYRMRSQEWKQLYRLGRDPVLVARDLARAWLSELK